MTTTRKDNPTMFNFTHVKPQSRATIEKVRGTLSHVIDALVEQGWTAVPMKETSKQYTEIYVELEHPEYGSMFLIVDLLRSKMSGVCVAVDGWKGKHRTRFYAHQGFEPTNVAAVLSTGDIARRLSALDKYGIGFYSTNEPGVFRQGSRGPKVTIGKEV